MSETLTVQNVAKRLQVSPSTIYKYTEDGTIASVKVGNRVRILEEDLISYLTANKNNFKQGERNEKLKTNKTGRDKKI
jgi:excisionase family DNA binding protein